MSNSKEILKEYVNSKSKFYNLQNGDEDTIRFISAYPITTHYQGKPIDSIRYCIEKDGKEMFWDRSNRELAQQMLSFNEVILSRST